MSTVPDCFVKLKKVDYDLELLCAFDVGFELGRRVIPPPGIGVFSLLEMIESRWYTQRSTCDLLDLYKVAYICFHRETCVKEVYKHVQDGGRDKHATIGDKSSHLEWDKKVLYWAGECDENFDYLLDNEKLTNGEFDNFMALASSGYEMLPKSKNEDARDYLFGADTVADVARSLCKNLGVTLFDAIWRVSLCFAGHVVANGAKEEGQLVRRGWDMDDMHTKVDEATAREKRGEVHPWQVLYPEYYPLTKVQIEADPQVFAVFDAARERLQEIGVAAMMEEWKEAGIVRLK